MFYPHFDLPIGVDLLAYGKDPVTSGLQAGDRFLAQMWRESQLLCESEGWSRRTGFGSRSTPNG